MAAPAAGVVAATPAEPEVLTERKPKEEEAAGDKDKDRRRSRWRRPSSGSAIPARSTGTRGTTWGRVSWTGSPGRCRRASTREGGHLVAPARWHGETVYLVKPQCFVNESGPAVARLCRRLHLGPADLIVVFDDLDLPLGHSARPHEGQRGRPQRRALAHRGLRHRRGPARQGRHRPAGPPAGERRRDEVVDHVLSPSPGETSWWPGPARRPPSTRSSSSTAVRGREIAAPGGPWYTVVV